MALVRVFVMSAVVRGYWLMAWIGLLANVAALPIIGVVAFTNQALQTIKLMILTDEVPEKFYNLEFTYLFVVC